MKVTIDANFDPESKEDLEWVEGEMLKILKEIPEIKMLEDKLKMSKKTEDSLDDVVEHLTKATDTIGMIKKKESKKDTKDEKKDDDKKDVKKPKGDDKKVEKKDDKKDASKDAKKDGDKDKKAAAPAAGDKKDAKAAAPKALG